MNQKLLRPPFLKAAFLPFAFSLLPFALLATHNRAGEILIKQIGLCGDYRVQATVITYTKQSSTSADRDSLVIEWGDGKFLMIPRVNGPGNGGESLGNDIKKNVYIGEHQFAGPARYVVSMTDPNRIKGIINVNPPSSDNVPFHIETVYVVPDCQFGSLNSTPVLLQPPIDFACVGQIFRHNPNAFDPDKDSLSYQLIVPLAAAGAPVPNYIFPGQVAGGSLFQLDSKTGDMIWASPKQAGEYNVAFYVVSWRQLVPGIWSPTDTTIRDMQIFVEDCNDVPPTVTAPFEICVVAGDTVEFEVVGNDLDTGQLVKLTALGGPFQVAISPATFSAPTGFKKPPVKGIFQWITACEHISDQFYSVVFKATDNFFDSTGLADLRQVRIKVVGPPPLDPQAVSKNTGEVEISWQKPYRCEAAADDYFYAFSVWRREGPKPLAPDTCNPGLAGKGYSKLIDSVELVQNGRYFFLDKNVEQGHTYCYRIEGKFAQTSFGGYPFNIVESLPSEEVCVQLPKDLPLITNVSIDKTGTTDGEIFVAWSKPNADDLDTLKHPGPYRYQVLRAANFFGMGLVEVPLGSFSSASFAATNDTLFVDNQRDTRGGPFSYRVDFYVNGEAEPLGSTEVASSVFLKIQSTDQRNNLAWEEHVPWKNSAYSIYRKNDATGNFDSIGVATEPAFSDIGLVNGKQYCYLVKSIGTYAIGGVIDPILNWSQEVCGVPIDTVPPCAPVLLVSNICLTGEPFDPTQPLENQLVWTNPNHACDGPDDVAGYTISVQNGDVVTILETLNSANDTFYVHQVSGSLAGCYTVSAFDSVGNVSHSQAICVDNCPDYVLPNTFTPNGDGANEVFKPFPGWRFISRIDMQIFNRWGGLVFSTTDPAINWNGQNSRGDELAAGTYYFTCRVFEQRVEGIVERDGLLSGWIELLR